MNEKLLEALLFALGRPLARAELARMFSLTGAQVEEELQKLQERVGERGIVIVDDGREVQLRAMGAAAALIEKVRKEEYTREIGRAGLEALCAVLYRGPLTRSQIDFIRGVNSTQTLRTLTMRGLLRKIPNPKDERSFLYEPTGELLAQLGVAKVAELPDYGEVREKIQKLEEAYRQKQEESV